MAYTQDPSNDQQYFVGSAHPLVYLNQIIHFVTILLGSLFDDRQSQKSEEWVQEFSDTLQHILSPQLLNCNLSDDIRMRMTGTNFADSRKICRFIKIFADS